MKYCAKCGLGTEDMYKVPKFCSHCGNGFGVTASQPAQTQPVQYIQTVPFITAPLDLEMIVEAESPRESLADVLKSEKTGEVRRPAGRKNRNVVKEFQAELKSKSLK
jgi:hypothetical protein